MPSTQTDRRDGISTSVAVKVPVKAYTTSALTQTGEQTIGGVACVDGDRYLRNVSPADSTNGIWIVRTGVHERSRDFDGNIDVVQGTLVLLAGTGATATIYRVTTANPITIGTTAIAFAASGVDDIANLLFQQAGTGSVVRGAQDKMRDLVTTADFGPDPTGVADSTTALQNAITYARQQSGDSRTLLWRKGTYKVTGQLTLGSQQHIIFEPGVTVDATGLPNENTSLFAISNQTGVTLEGNGAVLNGARAAANPAVEGVSAAFYVYGSDNVVIRDFSISGFATDGITLTGDSGSSGPCTNIRVEGVDCYNNRRNGMSIIHAIGVSVVGGRYRNSNGAPSGPWAGIDVEPNANEYAQDIALIGVRTQANNGPGLLFVPASMAGTTATFDVAVFGGRSEGDGSVGGIPALRFANGASLSSQVYGQVTIDGFTIVSPNSSGVAFTNWDADKCPRVTLNDVLVIDPDGMATASTNPTRSAFTLYCDSAQAITNLGGITMRNCRAEDTRGTPRMVNGFWLDVASGKKLKNVRIIDPYAANFTASTKVDVNSGAAAVAGGMIDVDVIYTTPRQLDINGSATITNFAGKRLNATGGGNNWTLPLAANCKGTAYEVTVANGQSTNSFVAQSGETIKIPGSAAANTLNINAGECIRVRSDGGTQWIAAYIA